MNFTYTKLEKNIDFFHTYCFPRLVPISRRTQANRRSANPHHRSGTVDSDNNY